MIPDSVVKKLEGDVYERLDRAATASCLARLGVTSDSSQAFRDFFMRYRGPLGSNSIGFELLDLYEEEPSIVTSTEFSRLNFNLPSNFLVITNVLAGGVLCYDTERDEIVETDFEGGIEMLRAGEIPARWTSFLSFICDFVT